MKKEKRSALIVIIVIILLIGSCFYIYNNGWKDYFAINVYDIFTIVIALVVTYYLTERKNDERKLNDKIENVCTDIQLYLRENYSDMPSKQNKEKTLMNIRYISNKIYILENLTEKRNDIKGAVTYIKEEHDKYNEFVSNNLDQEIEYFEEENRFKKLKTNINNIENKLDEIIVYLYTGQIPTTHK